MNTRAISIISGTALLALTASASAGPMSIASSQVVTPAVPIAQAHYYYRHHYRHYGWRHHRYYHRYYGWNPGAAVAGAALGLATVPFALATGGYYGPYYGYGPYYYY